MSATHLHIETRVVEFFRTRGLLAPGRHFVVAASGGRDSTVLAYVMASVAASWDCSLTLATVHHGLRPDADAEVEFVRSLAMQLNAGFAFRKVDVNGEIRRSGGSVQDVARRLRYQALEEMCGEAGASVILTAHHAEDQAETLLAHFLRGAGPEGLSGIRPVVGRVARPFLNVAQQEIQDLAAAQSVEWMHDSSNDSDKYRRNALRHHVSPSITRVVGPGWVQALGDSAKLFALLASFLKEHGSLLADRHITEVGDGIMVSGNSLNGSTEFEKLAVCRFALHELRGTEASLDESFSLLRLMEAAPGDTAQLRSGVTALREKDGLRLLPPVEDRPPVGVRLGSSVNWGTWLLTSEELGNQPPEFTSDRSEEFIDLDATGRQLRLRHWTADDRFEPFGFGHEKTVGSFLADSGFPLARRRRIPVLEGAAGIIWVCGLRLAQHAAIGPSSRHIARLRITIDDNISLSPAANTYDF
ncbi:MAG: tRNA lysidine(34) synthetase TilS [Bacteroidota bacterium]